MSDDVFTARSMQDLPSAKQAATAIEHVLRRIHGDPSVGWYLGIGTESFALLTEAYATLTGFALDEVRRTFNCPNTADPSTAAKAEAEDVESMIDAAVREAREEWSPTRGEITDTVTGMAVPGRLELLQILRDGFCTRCGGRTIIRPCLCRIGVTITAQRNPQPLMEVAG